MDNNALVEQLNTLVLQAEAKALTEAIHWQDLSNRHVTLTEAWGDQVDTREYLYDSNWGSSEFGGYYPTLNDRNEGQYAPFFENEHEHALTRGMGLVLSERYPVGVTIAESLNNYTISEGFDVEAVSPEGIEENKALLAKANYVIATFMDDNDWQSDLESEIHDESRVRGESVIRLTPKGWHTQADLLEPEQLTEPGSQRQLNEYVFDLIGGEFVPSWSFGVLTKSNEHSRPRGYHVIYDGIGHDWDFFPSDPIPCGNRVLGCIEHIKRNTPRNVKRGLTDYYPVAAIIKQAHTLLDNLGYGASMQAAIAWIVEHAPGVTQGQVSGLLAGRATEQVTRDYPAGSRTTNREKIHKGHVVHTPNGRKYQYGPLGQNNSPNYVLVNQALLRCAGSRWQFPEGLISGDWSNNNFASSLIAEGPFVKAREKDQRFYASRQHRLFWKVLRIAHYGGAFGGASWEQVEHCVDLKIKPPAVSTRDRLEMAQENQIMVQLGARSAQTAAEQMGDDWEQEQKRGLSAMQPAGMPADGTQAPVTGELGTYGRRQQLNSIKGADDVLAAFRDGTRTEVQAVQLLQSLGMSPERAQVLVDDAKGIQAVAESVQHRIIEELWRRYP